MMMRKIIFIGGAIFTMISAIAQDQAPAVLTFKEAVKIGLKNNVALNTQKNQLEYTQLNKTSQMLQLGPTVQAQGSAYRVDGNSFNNNTGTVVNGVIDYVNGSVGASIPIFNGFNQINLYRQASSLNEAQLHYVNRSQQDVIQFVAAQYLTVLLDKELIKIYQDNVKTQQVQYDQIQAQVEVGSKAEADLKNQDVQLKNAELTLLRQRNSYLNDLNTLALTLQVDPTFDLDTLNWDINAILSDSLQLETLYTTAVERRSDLKQAEASEKAAQYGYYSFKGRYFPYLSAGVSYGSRYNYVQGFENRSFSDQFTKDNTQLSYGLSLTIPIYGGLSARTQTAMSRVSYENSKLRRRNAEVTIKTDVIRAYQNFTGAKTAYLANVEILKAAELSYQMEKERYDLDISNIAQLSLSNQMRIAARGNYQSSLYTLMFQNLLLQYAIGTLRFEDVP